MLGGSIWYSLWTTDAGNIKKVRLGQRAKLCRGFAQAIPRGSWLHMVCSEQCCVFSFLQELSVCIAQRNQFQSFHYNVAFLDFCVVLFSCYIKLLYYYFVCVIVPYQLSHNGAACCRNFDSDLNFES
jgi:hypothetical protein